MAPVKERRNDNYIRETLEPCSAPMQDALDNGWKFPTRKGFNNPPLAIHTAEALTLGLRVDN